MKRIATIIVLLMTLSQCYPQKKMVKDTVTAIEFELSGRRGRTSVKITSEFAISTSRTEKRFIVMTADQWAALQDAVHEINLPGMSKLKSPTSRRDVDGALHCRLFITTQKSIYESQYFDSGIPMTELKPLYDKIEAIRNAINYDGDIWTGQ